MHLFSLVLCKGSTHACHRVTDGGVLQPFAMSELQDGHINTVSNTKSPQGTL